MEYYRHSRYGRVAVTSVGVNPRSSVAVFGVALLALLSACSDRSPPLGRGLPKTFGPAAPYFDMRLKERFPIGSDAATLVTELRNEGFVIRDGRQPYQFSARYQAHDLVCKESWTVHWTAEQGKIATIGGSNEQACL